MKPLSLTLVSHPGHPLDLSVLEPSALAALKPQALRRLKLARGRGAVALGELFEIEAGDPNHVVLRGLNVACHRVGMGQKSGLIEVHGDLGDECGRDMQGGQLRVHGSAGAALGAGMRDGAIIVHGNAGSALGAPTPGAVRGMNGGSIVVTGGVGARAGERMRRGVVAIGGAAGPELGARMIAGTIAVFGACDTNPGLGMRRGTLLLARAPREFAPTFNDCGEFELGVMALLARQVVLLHRPFARPMRRFTRVRRWCGDMGHGGKGEILVACDE